MLMFKTKEVENQSRLRELERATDGKGKGTASSEGKAACNSDMARDLAAKKAGAAAHDAVVREACEAHKGKGHRAEKECLADPAILQKAKTAGDAAYRYHLATFAEADEEKVPAKGKAKGKAGGKSLAANGKVQGAAGCKDRMTATDKKEVDDIEMQD